MRPESLACPDCGGPMVSRRNKQERSRFWGCKYYPHCKGTRDVDGLSKAERALDADIDRSKDQR